MIGSHTPEVGSVGVTCSGELCYAAPRGQCGQGKWCSRDPGDAWRGGCGWPPPLPTHYRRTADGREHNDTTTDEAKTKISGAPIEPYPSLMLTAHRRPGVRSVESGRASIWLRAVTAHRCQPGVGQHNTREGRGCDKGLLTGVALLAASCSLASPWSGRLPQVCDVCPERMVRCSKD